jgi:hypothetical protein
MPLASDLVPYVSDPTASLILVNVVSARWTPAPTDPEWEDGTIQLRTVERFSGPGPAAGENFTIIGRRYGDPLKRRSMGFDSWNVVPFEAGAALVLAVRRAASNGWTPLAAEAVPHGDNTLVPSVRRAVEIERSNPAAQPPMLKDALTSKQDLLFRYALDAISTRTRVPRNQAAEMMAQALLSNGLQSNAKFQLVQQATKRPIYDDDHGSDSVNRLVIGAVSRVLVAESNPEWALIWAQLLSTSLLPAFSPDATKDADIRLTLIRSVPEPARHEVPGALTKAAGQSPADQRIPKLAEAWSAALR